MMRDLSGAPAAALRALLNDVRQRAWLRPFVAVTIAFQAGVVAWAALRSDGAPKVDPRATLEAGPEGRPAAPPEGEGLRVVFAAPKGALVDDVAGEVQIIWNRPLRALDSPPESAASVAQIEPAVPGAWSWVGTRALRFAPKGPWPPATEFKVTVPAGLKSVDDQVAQEAFTLSFTTPTPRVLGVRPGPDEKSVGKRQAVVVRFNQAVSLDEVRRAVSLQADGAPVRYAARHPQPGSAAVVELTPAADYPTDARVVVRVDASLRGQGGPLPAGKEYESSFQTYGPLKVESLQCAGGGDAPCRPGAPIEVRLSNRVKVGELKRALKVTPKAQLLWPSWMGDGELVDALEVTMAAAPGQSYAVSVEGTLRDEHGQGLAAPAQAELSFGDAEPALRLGLAGTFLPPNAPDVLPFRALNVASAEVAFAPLEPASLLELEAKGEARGEPDAAFDFVAKLPGAVRSELAFDAQANRVQDGRLSFGAARRAGGPVAVALRWKSKEELVHEARVVQFTDLALSAKVSKGASAAWVTRLSTGEPVPGAKLELWAPGGGDAPAVVAEADAEGVARFDASAVKKLDGAHLFVRAGDERSAHALDDELSAGRYDLPTGAAGELRGIVYGDRGIYRPGEKVHLGGLVRKTTPAGLETPEGAKVYVTVRGPEGEDFLEFEETLSKSGAFDRAIDLPATAKLGSYGVAASLTKAEGKPAGEGADDDEPWGRPEVLRHRFEVSEYRPAEFQVQVEADRAAYNRGDELSCRTRGTLLSGPAMANAPVRTVLVREEVPFEVPGAAGFVTTDVAYHAARDARTPRAGQLRGDQAALDAEGVHVLKARLDLPGQRNTERVICEAEVTDLSNQAIAGRAGAIVHPGSFYLGVKPPSDGFAKAGDVFVPTVIAADSAGARVAGVKAELELVERRWVIARQKGKQGAGHSEATVVDKVAARCTATTAAEPKPCLLRVPRAGHFIVRAAARDENKRPIGASFDVYATGAGEPGWADGDDNRVELVPERPSYAVGDVAHVLVKNPFGDAEALVTVEREGVLSSRRVKLSGPAPTIDVPVDEQMVPNAYVGVLLVRGGDAAAVGTPNAPRFRAGYAPIAVDSSPRKLKVVVRPTQPEMAPGETAEVEAELHDAADKPVVGEVTIFAVDEGSLSLTGYRTPEPWAAFFAPRPLGVRAFESRTQLGRIGRGPLGPMASWIAGLVGDDKGLDGGGGGDEGAPTRRDFRQTAAFLPKLTTDDAGRVRASFKLPDSLSTFRVMAVAAAADDRAGSGDAKIVTSKRLMLRAALPRVLRVGDKFDASVVVSSRGAPSGPVQVKLEAGGVGLLEGGERTVDLPERGSVAVRFPVEVTRAGEASFSFSAQAGADRDALEVKRRASPPTLVEVSALYGQTKGAAAESLGDFAALRDDVGGLSVGLSSSALVGVAGGVDWLLEYPYGCTEQLTSRLVPLLAVNGLVRSQGLEPAKDPQLLATLAVVKLLKHQRYDGGFGLWPEARHSLPWVSTYALWGLGLAKREAIAVPADALARATKYVGTLLKASAGGDEGKGKAADDEGGREGAGDDAAPKVAPTDAAFAADVLAELGEPDPGSMTRLYEARERLPLFAKALLLHAMAVAQGKAGDVAAEAADQRKADLATLRGEVALALRLDGPVAKVVTTESSEDVHPYFDSPVRAAAMVLRGLVAADPNEPLAAPLARGILADRVDGHWRTTQESAWALLALEDYRRAQEPTPPSLRARAYVGDELLGEASLRGTAVGAKLSVPAEKTFGSGGGLLSFDVRGSGTLFYEARLTYARREPPKNPVEAGFFVERVLRAAGGAAGAAKGPRPASDAAGAALTEAREGDLVVIEALVTSPLRRSFVVVDVPLPAGLEAIDATLATSARFGREGKPARGFVEDYTRREIRDDRVVFFADELAPGVHAYRFLARATSAGEFALPPAHAEEMYAPEVYGATPAARFRVPPKP